MKQSRACVLGASGGIGAALVDRLAEAGYETVYAGARVPRAGAPPNVLPLRFDLLDESSLAEAADRIAADGPLHLVVVATGMLHDEGIGPEKSARQIDAAAMTEVFAVNTIGPALAAKYFLPLLARDRCAVIAFLSARVGSIGDNRLGGWHSYRASKAALNALVRCFAIELAVRNPEAIAVALHPGTVDTPLSKPFQRNVPAGRLFEPEDSARHLLAVIERLTPAESGGLFAWDGSPIEY